MFVCANIYYRIGILSIIIFACLLIRICLTIYFLETNNNDTLTTIDPPVTAYLCPQFVASSRGYFYVDLTENFSTNYSSICQSDDILLIYILSKADHIERREVIRRTWANKDTYEQLFPVCFIFLIGLTDNPYVYIEARKYNDIVQLNITETYQNIVYKEVGGLKWSHLYASHIPYLFKTDDDIIVDTILLSDITKFFINNQTYHSHYLEKEDGIKEFTRQTYTVNKFTFFQGILKNGYRTKRQGKFALNSLAWNSELLPGYCSGAGYMFSSFIRDRLYRASLCYAIDYVSWMSDLFVSGFLASVATVKCSSWLLEYSQSSEGCFAPFQNQSRLLLCSTPMHIGRLYMEDYDQAWKAILQRHSITNEIVEKMKRNRIEYLEKRLKDKLPIKESIIEQMGNKPMILPDEQIIPYNQMEQKLD